MLLVAGGIGAGGAGTLGPLTLIVKDPPPFLLDLFELLLPAMQNMCTHHRRYCQFMRVAHVLP
jgi:hypothetical protein